MSNLMAQLGAGAAAGFAGAAAEERDRPLRDMRIQEAQLRLDQAKQEHGDYTAAKPLRDAEMEAKVNAAQELAYKTRRDFASRRTFDAFKSYQADKDPRHINNFLSWAKSDPSTASTFGSIARVDSLDATDPTQVESMLAQAGYDPKMILSSPELKSEFISATATDGSINLYSMSKLMALTGYTREMGKLDLQEQEEKMKLLQSMQGPRNADTQATWDLANELAAQGVENPFQEALRIRDAAKPKGTYKDRVLAIVKEQNPDMPEEEQVQRAAEIAAAGTAAEREAREMAKVRGIPYYDALRIVNGENERTSTMKNVDAAPAVRREIDKAAGGDFFSMDLAKPENRRKIGEHITKLEQLTGKELSTEDKRIARTIRDLISLGGMAGENVQPEETGLIDSMLGKARKYATEQGGKNGTAAYETFRNVVRNSLYGASLTGAEIQSFNAAAGTLGQQLGPVLGQLEVQLLSVKNQLSAIYDFNDEYVAYYYLGKDREDLDKTIQALEERIELVRNAGSKSRAKETVKRPTKPAATVTPPTQKDAFAILEEARKGKAKQ